MRKHLLLVDDSALGLELAHLALQRAGFGDAAVTCRGGVQALGYLDQATAAGQSLPSLVLLDINMPRMNGHEALRAIRQRPHLDSLPVVMFSTSSEVRDIERSYELGASGYVVKPIGLHKLVFCMAGVCNFWLQVNQPPPGNGRRLTRHGAA